MLALADTADLDRGPRAGRTGPARTCAVTRQVRPVDELIRFVVAPNGQVVPDLKRKLPGRGLWVSASRQMVESARKRRVFSRGFRREVIVSPDLAAETERLLARGAVEALAMAAKAGQVLSGFAKVEGALEQGQAVVLIHAADAAADGVRKLAAVARKAAEKARSNEIAVITALSSAELDLALGRANVIHAAVLTGPAAKTFLSRSQSLVRYRMADEGGADRKAAQTSPTPTAQTRARQQD